MVSTRKETRCKAHVLKSRTEDWNALPWKHIQREALRLQRHIYQAERRGDHKQVHNLQRLLLGSGSARCLAVRQVTQDNRGKRTPGVDGMANLTPKQRMAPAEEPGELLNWQADPMAIGRIGGSAWDATRRNRPEYLTC